MISIVVCSAKETLFAQFSKSVEETIGVPYEIIRIDNSKNEHSICAAYNKGAGMCKYDIICLPHEDVIFETRNWGSIIVNLFKNPEIGLAGNLGTCYYSMFPRDWQNILELEGQVRVGALPNNPLQTYARYPGNSIAEVVAVDGMFMVTSRKIMNQFRFSEDILKGFHGYDVDISMQIREHYKVVVTRDIRLLHLSGGAFNASYYETMELLYKKWKHKLPAYLPAYTKKEIRDLKTKTLDKYFQQPVSGKYAGILYAFHQGVLIHWLWQKISRKLKKYNRAKMAGTPSDS
jgi:hypothetical protein